MTLKEAVIDVLTNTKEQKYAVIAKDSSILDSIKNTVIETVDLGKTTTHVYLSHPIGINHIKVPLNGLWVEGGCTSEEHLVKFLTILDYNNVHYFDKDGNILVAEVNVNSLPV